MTEEEFLGRPVPRKCQVCLEELIDPSIGIASICEHCGGTSKRKKHQMTDESILEQPVSEAELATALRVSGNEQVQWILRRLAFERDVKKSLTIVELIREAHATAVEKGWWEKDRPFSEGIALMHSELSEALEEWRKDGLKKMLYYNQHSFAGPSPEDDKPEGVAAELADVLIRIGDWCGKHNIPLEEALRAKMGYNKTRPHRHGGKLA